MTVLAPIAEERGCPSCGHDLDGGTPGSPCVRCQTLVCSGCGSAIDESEEGRCAFCRMLDRGDDLLVCHDSRGWVERTTRARRPHMRKIVVTEHRVPCGCGCGMVEVPYPAANLLNDHEEALREAERRRREAERWSMVSSDGRLDELIEGVLDDVDRIFERDRRRDG